MNSAMREVPEGAIRQLFGELKDWALLRNVDVFSNFARGGDCDLIVGDLEGTRELIISLIGDPLRIAVRSYITSFYYPWGHFDVADSYYWRGFKLLEGKQLLNEARNDQEWPIVSDSDQAIIMLLGSLLWGGFVKERYKDFIAESFIKYKSAVNVRLSEMLGAAATRTILLKVDACDWRGLEESARRIRRSVSMHNVSKRPIRSLSGYVNFFAKEIGLRLMPHVPVLAFALPTSSKSIDLKGLAEELLVRLDYHIKVFDCTGFGRIGLDFRMMILLLRMCSFRARNGLLVILVNSRKSGSGSTAIRGGLMFHLKSTCEFEIMRGVEEYYKFSTCRFKKV